MLKDILSIYIQKIWLRFASWTLEVLLFPNNEGHSQFPVNKTIRIPLNTLHYILLVPFLLLLLNAFHNSLSMDMLLLAIKLICVLGTTMKRFWWQPNKYRKYSKYDIAST